MERWENKVAVVTGASSGIGEAIVKDLVEHGLRVIGLARRVERVEAIQEELSEEKRNMLLPLQCDVTDLESVNDAFDKIISEYGNVDILINNAGFMKFGQLISMDVSDIKQTVDTNILGVVYCTQRAVKSMMEENIAGHIIMINSVAGHVTVSHEGVQQTNIYGPSKYAITAMTEILRQEFKDLNTRIKVTVRFFFEFLNYI